MSKTVKIIIFSLLSVLLLTGCTKEVKNDPPRIIEETNGKCGALECIKNITPTSTLEEVNKIIGFEGKLKKAKYNKYYWTLSKDSGIEVRFTDDGNNTIRADFNKSIIANENVDFSRYEEFKPKIKNGLLYLDFISYIGGVDGTIVEKNAKEIKMMWVNKDNKYLTATFDSNSSMCFLVITNIN